MEESNTEFRTSYHITGTGYTGTNLNTTLSIMKNVLVTRHNAGFFSCCSIRLLDIMIYFNEHQSLPDIVDSWEQFGHYKSYAMENLVPFYFEDHSEIEIPYNGRREMTYAKEEPQFSDYRLIDFNNTNLYRDRYFQPSEHIRNIIDFYQEKYNIDFENTCGVFYRGNDKNRETTIAPYDEFINKAREIRQKNPNIRFLIQPDETEFLFAFKQEFPNCFWIEETPHMMKKDSCMVFETPQNQRAEYGAKFFAAVLTLSKCKHLITHSGNGSFWAVVYRGNMDNVYQILHNKWLT